MNLNGLIDSPTLNLVIYVLDTIHSFKMAQYLISHKYDSKMAFILDKDQAGKSQ